jgi:hypothetical protein
MAVTVPQDRLAGFRGSVYFGSNKILDIFDWTLEIQQEVAMAAIKGEVHNNYAAGGVTSRVTAQRFSTDVTTDLSNSGPPTNEQGGSVFAQNLVADVPAAGNTPSWSGKTVTFTLYSVDTVSTQGFKVTGEGFITRVNQNNPRGTVTEAFELQCTIMPTFAN